MIKRLAKERPELTFTTLLSTCVHQNTNINQRPLVETGDVVCQGDVIADGLRRIWASLLSVRIC